jgi:hypothetical protein
MPIVENKTGIGQMIWGKLRMVMVKVTKMGGVNVQDTTCTGYYKEQLKKWDLISPSVMIIMICEHTMMIINIPVQQIVIRI